VAVAAQAPYKRGVVLNTGFAARNLSQDEVEERAATGASASSPAIVAYARMIGLEQGDVIQVTLMGPDGKVLAASTLPALDHDKAQFQAAVGRKAPPAGWARGTYSGEVQVRRQGAVAVSRRWQTTL
jgi:hypothetical protein